MPLAAPRLRFLSNLTGTWISDEQATDPAYWARQLRAPVRFSAGVVELLGDPGRVLVEVGPGRALSTLVERHPGAIAAPSQLRSQHSPASNKKGGVMHAA